MAYEPDETINVEDSFSDKEQSAAKTLSVFAKGDTLCHSCLKVHGGVPIGLCIFAKPKRGWPTPGFSIFIRSDRPIERLSEQVSFISLDQILVPTLSLRDKGTKGQHRNIGTKVQHRN